ncbi:transposase, partial [Acinetobacter indicus]
MNPLASLAPAIKDIASAQKTSFATTQAVWRFLNNEKITFKQLNEPIHQLACEQIKTSQHDSGYELQTSLLVDAASGLPIAPLAQTLTDALGCYSTFNEQHTERQTHLDSLA